MGPVLYAMVAPLHSYFCCSRFNIVPVPLIKLSLALRQSLSKCPHMAPGRVQYGSSENCRCSHWLWSWLHPLLLLNGHLPEDSHTQGVCIRMVAVGPGIGLWEGVALFWSQKHSTVALWPSSGNNDTAEPIDISRNSDTAAATSPQWHSTALLRGHDVTHSEAFPEELGCVSCMLFTWIFLICMMKGKTSVFQDNFLQIMSSAPLIIRFMTEAADQAGQEVRHRKGKEHKFNFQSKTPCADFWPWKQTKKSINQW